MSFHLIDLKTSEELNLPKLNTMYEPIKIQKGTDLVRKWFGKNGLRTKFIDYTSCLRKNCVIVSHPIKKGMEYMYKGQTEYYKLIHKNKLKKLSSEYVVLYGCPNKVKIKFDILKNKMRIEGRGCGWGWNGYKGDWIFFDDYEGEKNEI